jgi:hypothetical protein
MITNIGREVYLQVSEPGLLRGRKLQLRTRSDVGPPGSSNPGPVGP